MPDEEQDSTREPRRPAARRRTASGLMAGIALGLREVLDPPKDDVTVTVEASGEPGDIDRDGIRVDHADASLSAPALPPLPSESTARTAKRKKRTR